MRCHNYIFVVTGIIIALLGLLPANALAQQDRADHYFHQGAYSIALQRYQKVLNDSPDNAAYLQNQIGECYLRMDLPDDALGWFISAQKSGYNQAGILYSLGLTNMSLGQYDQALAYFQEYAAKQPDDKRTAAKIASCKLAKANTGSNAAFALHPVHEFNTSGSEYGAAYYHNQLVYSSTGEGVPTKSRDISPRTGLGYSNLYIAQAINDTLFSTGKKLNNISNDKVNRGVFTYDSINNKLYCTTCRNGQKDCYISVIKIKGSHYKEVGRLEIGNTEYGIGHPYVTPNGQRLYFTSTMAGGYGGDDIWYSQRQANGKWSAPINAGAAVNTAANEVFPYVQGDYLFFSSDGHEGFGGLDLYVVKYNESNNGKAFNLQRPFNSEYDDFNLILNEKNTGGLMVSNRNNKQNNDNLYSFKGYPCIVVIEGNIYDKATQKPLQGANVEVYNNMEKPLQKVVTDSEGHYQTFLQSGYDNRLNIFAQGYKNEEKYFDTKSTPCFSNIDKLNGYETDFYLDKIAIIAPQEIKYTVEFKDIFYEFDLARITAESEVELDELADLMKKYPQLSVKLAAHTDVRGSKEYNQELSDKRALAVKIYLRKKGISSSRIETRGYGETLLLIPNAHNEAEQQLNRRTIFTLYSAEPLSGVQVEMLSTEKLLQRQTPDEITGYSKWWVEVASAKKAGLEDISRWEKLTGSSVEAIKGDDGLMHICIGPFDSPQQAAPAVDQLNKKGIKTIVKEIDPASASSEPRATQFKK